MPSEALPDYAFRNRGDLTFEDVSTAWGLADSTFANGAAYGDLDLDGDLDLVVNILDGPAALYRNGAEAFPDRHHLRIRLDGAGANRLGVGARVRVTTGRTIQTAEQVLTRGFYSSVEPVLHFGLGAATRADVVEVTWPSGRTQRLGPVGADTTITLREADGAAPAGGPRAPVSTAAASDPNALFAATAEGALGAGGLAEGALAWRHREDAWDDFKRNVLLPHQLGREGPALAHADVNGDRRPDVFLGGAAGQPGALFLQTDAGGFREGQGRGPPTPRSKRRPRRSSTPTATATPTSTSSRAGATCRPATPATPTGSTSATGAAGSPSRRPGAAAPPDERVGRGAARRGRRRRRGPLRRWAPRAGSVPRGAAKRAAAQRRTRAVPDDTRALARRCWTASASSRTPCGPTSTATGRPSSSSSASGWRSRSSSGARGDGTRLRRWPTPRAGGTPSSRPISMGTEIRISRRATSG